MRYVKSEYHWQTKHEGGFSLYEDRTSGDYLLVSHVTKGDEQGDWLLATIHNAAAALVLFDAAVAFAAKWK